MSGHNYPRHAIIVKHDLDAFVRDGNEIKLRPLFADSSRTIKGVDNDSIGIIISSFDKIIKYEMKVFAMLTLATFTSGFERKPTGGLRPCDFFRRTAKVEFKGAVQGTINFVSNSCGGKGVSMKGQLKVRSIKDEAELQWHVHQLGTITRKCDQTGEPFNPYDAPSGT